MSKRFRILAVDDESINLQLITGHLKSEYEILTSPNGYDAIEQLDKHDIDLILLDVMMPGMNGFEVCSAIKADERFADIPVIFLTALDSMDSQLQGFEQGGIDYLTKPINFALLKLLVRNHITLKERNDLVKEQRDLLTQKNEQLEAALAQIKRLEGIIPICSYCKKIRDDQNSWQQLEKYISEHSDAMFSHGMCPDCVEEQMKILLDTNLYKTR